MNKIKTYDDSLNHDGWYFSHYAGDSVSWTSLDARYSVQKEFAGHSVPVFVARFCGDFIKSSKNLVDCLKIVQNHKLSRLKQQ